MIQASSLKKLTNQELELRLKDLAIKERKLLHVILEHIKELEIRKLYLARAYPSVFEYLVKELGYSTSAAMRRLEAARLLRDVPIVAEKIQEGVLNLSQICELSRALKEKEKISGDKVSCTLKTELVQAISGKTTQETQKELAVVLDIPIREFEKQKVQQDHSLRIEITLNKVQAEKLHQCKNLAAHLLMQKFNSDNSWATLFEVLADQYLNKKKVAPLKKQTLAAGKDEATINTQFTSATQENKMGESKSFSSKSSVSNKNLKKTSKTNFYSSSSSSSSSASTSALSSASSSAASSSAASSSAASSSAVLFSAPLSPSLSQNQNQNQNQIQTKNQTQSRIPIQSQNPTIAKPRATEISPKTELNSKSNPIADAAIQSRIYKKITPLLRRTILIRDECCQFIDPQTQKRCLSKFGLEVDHKTSQWAGGQHRSSNLQALCRKHNIHKYHLESGVQAL